MNKTVYTVLFSLLFTGCAHWDIHQKDQESKYLGQPLEVMYDEYGVPVGAAPLQGGGKFVEFRYFRGRFSCTSSVKTDERGRIISLTVGGQNGCITGRY